MDAITPIDLVTLMGAAAICALLVLWLSGLFLSGASRRPAPMPASPNDAVFLFHNDKLTDFDIGAVAPGDDTLETLENWDGFRGAIGALFPDLPQTPADLPEDTQAHFAATGATKGASLTCHRQGAVTRLRLTLEEVPNTWSIVNNAATGHGQTRQIKALRDAPNAVCVTDTGGRVAWRNTEWSTLPPVITETAIQDTEQTKDCAPHHKRISDPDTGRVFEVRIAGQETGQSFYVSEVTGLVQAENAQRKFVQTLTKTFANLTTGLAVFDRNQELALFNPALLDLTSLPAPFLTARPHVMSFFDGLRDRHVMPEPRNYAKWRTHILEMIESASDGLYQENWALSSGLTYQITGRPHPDGAVAFLIEDITDEMSIKRRFRTQLDLRQLVLDEMDDAITVFDSRNLLMFCNQRCADILGIDPDSSFADFSVTDIIKAYGDTPIGKADWGEVEAKLTSDKGGLNDKWMLRGRAGCLAECRVRSLSGGTKMLQVRPDAANAKARKTSERA